MREIISIRDFTKLKNVVLISARQRGRGKNDTRQQM
jgi:hypothetical protein